MGAKSKFKPFPKLTNPATGKKRVDILKLKEMYLEGPEMTFKKFCERNRFNSKVSAHDWYGDVDLESWKREWIRKQCDIQDEDVVPSLLDARRLVSKNRASFIIDWNNRASVMKKMLDYLTQKHLDDMKWDIQNTLAIQAGRAQRRCNLSIDEMQTIAGTAQRLQDLEAKSLLLMPIQLTQSKPGDIEDAASSGEAQTPEFEFHTMGTAGMNPAEITKLMAGYFDQVELPKQIEVTSEQPAPSQDQS